MQQQRQHYDDNNNNSNNDDDDDSDVRQLRNEKRLKLQQREHDLLEMQRELKVQLHQVYMEQQQLAAAGDAPDMATTIADDAVAFEIPSYCANCLGDIYEPSGKSSLSSEFSRNDGDVNKDAKPDGEPTPPQLSDTNRLEAIKQQILLKLGFKNKPNITNTLPKQFAIDTLRRTGDPTFNFDQHATLLLQAGDVSSFDVMEQLNQLKEGNASHVNETQQEDDNDFDDFYGKTREIIIFADRGKLRVMRLVNVTFTLLS